jgi:hypothetical protein
MWIEAIYNVVKENTSDFSVWGLFPDWLKRFLLDVDLEHFRLKKIRTVTTATDTSVSGGWGRRYELLRRPPALSDTSVSGGYRGRQRGWRRSYN